MLESPHDLELAVEAWIEEKLLKPASVKRKGVLSVARLPRISAWVDAGDCEEITATVFKTKAKLYVYLEVKNISTANPDEARRKAALPMAQAIFSVLSGQKLGLDITRIKPVGFNNVTEPADQAAGMICFLLEFSSVFEFRKLEEEAAANLAELVLDYLLKPGDDEVDSSSKIDIADKIAAENT